MLQKLASVSNAIGLRTHYFDDVSLNKLDGIRDKFDYAPCIVTTLHGRRTRLYRQRYREAPEWAGGLLRWRGTDQHLDGTRGHPRRAVRRKLRL
jgi:hypothetical protein